MAFAGYPLLAHGELVGVLAMFARHELFDPALDALASVADSIALAIQRGRVVAEVHVSTQLYRIATALASQLGADGIVQTVTDAATEATGAQFGAFFYNVIDPSSASTTSPPILASGRTRPTGGMPEGHLPVRSYLAVPVVSRRAEVLGGLFFGHAQPGVFSEQHEQMVAAIAGHTAVALENARLYEREHNVAVTLQRAVLPEQLPDTDAVSLAGVYLPGTKHTEVGADWYDALELPSGQLALAVGDVAGHDLTAAAAMGQLRAVARAYALQDSKPEAVLAHLDDFIEAGNLSTFLTVAQACATPGRAR